MQSVDVAIVGGGMVGWRLPAAYRGAAYALPYWSSAYRNLWRRMHHHNCAFRLSMPPAKNYSPVLASGRTFSRRASCYHGMEVWDKDSFGHISFDDQSMGYSHLGHIVENSVIHYALWSKAQQASDITLLAPAELQQVAREKMKLS